MNNNGVLDKIPMTALGLAELKEEFRKLAEDKRPLIVERLSEARKMGDLSENSEYINAKEELEFTDGRLAELGDVIDRASVIEEGANGSSEVRLGCSVTVEAPGGASTFRIVGEWEADPKEKKISHKSPLGKALLGKKVGEEFEFEAPAGKNLFKVVSVE